MTRLTVLAALALSFSLFAGVSHAAAQSWEPPRMQYTLTASADDLSHATDQHRIGSALVATGLTANFVGAGAAFFSILSSFSTSYDSTGCYGGCAPVQHPDWGALIATSLAASGVGLVMFFIGLGMDIHAHVVRDRAPGSVALGAGGLTITF